MESLINYNWLKWEICHFIIWILKGLKSSTQIIGCCVSLFLISPKLTLISSVVLPSAVLIGTVFGNILRTYSKIAQAQVNRTV